LRPRLFTLAYHRYELPLNSCVIADTMASSLFRRDFAELGTAGEMS